MSSGRDWKAELRGKLKHILLSSSKRVSLAFGLVEAYARAKKDNQLHHKCAVSPAGEFLGFNNDLNICEYCEEAFTILCSWTHGETFKRVLPVGIYIYQGLGLTPEVNAIDILKVVVNWAVSHRCLG
jgi:hypothetical protein